MQDLTSKSTIDINEANKVFDEIDKTIAKMRILLEKNSNNVDIKAKNPYSYEKMRINLIKNCLIVLMKCK